MGTEATGKLVHFACVHFSGRIIAHRWGKVHKHKSKIPGKKGHISG